MLPTLKEYYVRYAYLIVMVIFVICSLLMFSFMRNTTTISLIDAVAALCSIAFAITYNLVREQRNYWLYVIRSAKAIIDPNDLKKVDYTDKSAYAKEFSITRQPLISAIMSTIAAAILTYVSYLAIPNYFTYCVFFIGIVVYPIAACGIYYYILKYSIAQTLLFLTNKKNDYHQKNNLTTLICWDLFNYTLVNLALVLPIANRADFSLKEGYYSINFIGAMLILMIIVGFFTIITAKAQRKYSFIGELLSGEIDAVSMQSTPIIQKYGSTIRTNYLWYFFICIIWTIFSCVFFGTFIPVKSFTAIYLFCLLPILIIFCLERHLSLYNQFHYATIIQHHLQQDENLVELIKNIDKQAHARQVEIKKI